MNQMCPEKSEPTPCGCLIGSCTLREFREMAQPGGRKRALEEYHQQTRDRAAQRDNGMAPRDLPYRLQKIGIPLENITGTLGRLDESVALKAAKKFVLTKGPTVTFLVLVGEQSVGKTQAATHVVRDAAMHFDWNGQASGGVTVEPIQFVAASELTRVDTHDRVDNARLDSMRRCRLLVVDDMGDEGGSVGRGALLATILKRDAAGRPTVITSNLKAERFKELYGAPFVARVMARGIVPNLTGEKSRRKRAP
jgi:DNA replication protein DnaC